MKTLLALLLMVSAAQAQNWAVGKVGPNTNGIPEVWPIIIGPIGTNTTTKVPGATVMTMREIDTVIEANKAQFVTAMKVQEEQAATAQASAAADAKDAEIAALKLEIVALKAEIAILKGGKP